MTTGLVKLLAGYCFAHTRELAPARIIPKRERPTPVGPSDVCNADSLGEINLLDALEVVDEFFAAPDSPDLAIGSPDCDLSGTVNLLDALEVVDIFFGT